MCKFHPHEGEIDIRDNAGRKITTIPDADERDTICRKIITREGSDDEPQELDFEEVA
tara:strand:+ start:9116 stop:9286 length:171 start_codon:yes stop_codon:yes gene_type:complete